MPKEELLATFDCNSVMLSELFTNFLKQTDEVVNKAEDYNHMHIIWLITHEQFSVMVDILYEKFIPIGDINVSAAFLLN